MNHLAYYLRTLAAFYEETVSHINRNYLLERDMMTHL